ncbi:MAG: CAP family protein [Calothrix sp. MO_167.B42]|nr:CAP family protein [Calothrix sp. MO_167.B42]
MKSWQATILGIAGLTSAIALGTVTTSNVSAQSTGLATFRQEALSKHNTLRQRHGSPALTEDSGLTNLAQDWAQQLANTGQMQHRPNNQYGENIYYAWSSQPGFDVNGEVPVQAWYDEDEDYDYNNPGFSSQTGHFTQVVWKNSTKVGCGKAKSVDGKVFVVCNYDPPGNVQGQFSQNVLPVLSTMLFP